jgi:hypothetical protein
MDDNAKLDSVTKRVTIPLQQKTNLEYISIAAHGTLIAECRPYRRI